MTWLDALAYAVFFILFALTMHGFTLLGRKTGKRSLELSSRIYVIVLGILLLVIETDLVSGRFQFISHDSFAFYVIPFMIVPILCAYILGPVAIGWTAYSMRESYPAAKVVAFSAGIWFFYAVYYFGFIYLADIEPPLFLGLFFTVPIPEALFVAASMLLFIQASKR